MSSHRRTTAVSLSPASKQGPPNSPCSGTNPSRVGGLAHASSGTTPPAVPSFVGGSGRSFSVAVGCPVRLSRTRKGGAGTGWWESGIPSPSELSDSLRSGNGIRRPSRDKTDANRNLETEAMCQPPFLFSLLPVVRTRGILGPIYRPCDCTGLSILRYTLCIVI